MLNENILGQGWGGASFPGDLLSQLDLDGTFPAGLFLGNRSALASGPLTQVMVTQHSESRQKEVINLPPEVGDYITMGKIRGKCGVSCGGISVFTVWVPEE